MNRKSIGGRFGPLRGSSDYRVGFFFLVCWFRCCFFWGFFFAFKPDFLRRTAEEGKRGWGWDWAGGGWLEKAKTVDRNEALRLLRRQLMNGTRAGNWPQPRHARRCQRGEACPSPPLPLLLLLQPQQQQQPKARAGKKKNQRRKQKRVKDKQRKRNRRAVTEQKTAAHRFPFERFKENDAIFEITVERRSSSTLACFV